MQKTTLFLLVLLLSSNLFSQENYIKLSLSKTKNPHYIFNKDVLGNEKLLLSLGDSKEQILDQIIEVSILKEKPDSERYDYYNLSEYGLLFVDLKNNLVSKSQSELNVFFGLDPQNGIYIDGYLIESKKYKIATKSIIDLELIAPTKENGLRSKAINVWTLEKNERHTEVVIDSTLIGREK